MLKSKLEANYGNHKVQSVVLFGHIEPVGNEKGKSKKLELVKMEGIELLMNSQR